MGGVLFYLFIFQICILIVLFFLHYYNNSWCWDFYFIRWGMFELDLTSYLFYNFISVVSTLDYCSTILCMIGGLF